MNISFLSPGIVEPHEAKSIWINISKRNKGGTFCVMPYISSLAFLTDYCLPNDPAVPWMQNWVSKQRTRCLDGPQQFKHICCEWLRTFKRALATFCWQYIFPLQTDTIVCGCGCVSTWDGVSCVLPTGGENESLERETAFSFTKEKKSYSYFPLRKIMGRESTKDLQQHC